MTLRGNLRSLVLAPRLRVSAREILLALIERADLESVSEMGGACFGLNAALRCSMNSACSMTTNAKMMSGSAARD